MRISLLSAAIVAALLNPAEAVAQSAAVAVTLAGAAATDSSIRVHVVVSTIGTTSRVVGLDSTADKRRRVLVGQIPAGRYQVETRALGFVPDTSFVQLDEGQTRSLTVDLRRVASLDPVNVAGTGASYLAGFEKRRAAGKGTFVTRGEIEKSGRSQVAEVLRSMRGLRVDCGGARCRVRMARSTACEPRYFMNGFPSDAAILHTPLLDIAGIEVYRGPSETPGEFMGAQSMCGAVVVWVR